jgi:hypothetical protein
VSDSQQQQQGDGVCAVLCTHACLQRIYILHQLNRPAKQGFVRHNMRADQAAAFRRVPTVTRASQQQDSDNTCAVLCTHACSAHPAPTQHGCKARTVRHNRLVMMSMLADQLVAGGGYSNSTPGRIYTCLMPVSVSVSIYVSVSVLFFPAQGPAAQHPPASWA